MTTKLLDEAMAQARRQPAPAGRALVRYGKGENDFVAVGHWKPEWHSAPPGSWISKARGLFGQALLIAQRQYDENNARQLARSEGKKIPEPGDLEQRQLEIEMKQVEQIANLLGELSENIAAEKAKLTAYDIDPTDVSSAMVRMQIRDRLAGMDAKARSDLLRSADELTAAAVLEAPASLSGLAELPYQNFRDARLRARHGQAVTDLAEAAEAAALVSRAVKAAKLSTRENLLPLLERQIKPSLPKLNTPAWVPETPAAQQ